MKYTTEQAIQKLIEVDKKLNHNQYDYEKTIYNGSVNPIIVNCKIHGDFTIQFNNKLQGQNCKLCSRIRSEKDLKNRFNNFIEKIKNKHSNLTFEKFIYKDSHQKSVVTCKIHGDFLIAPKHLAYKSNCPECTKYNNKINNIKSKFYEKEIKEKFGDLYKYEKIPTTKNEKFTLKCKKHGNFSKTIETLLTSKGCKKCSKEINVQTKLFNDFVKQANILHNYKYSYSEDNYKGSKSYITITCPIHGGFLQRCGDHLRSKGCTCCGREYSNYSKNQWIKRSKGKIGTFYIIKCIETNDQIFYKVGITFNTVKQRYPKRSMPYNYEVIKEEKSFDLSYIWDLEKKYIKLHQQFKYKPLLPFKGDKTECFSEIKII